MHKTCEFQANCDNEKVKAMIKEKLTVAFKKLKECKHKNLFVNQCFEKSGSFRLQNVLFHPDSGQNCPDIIF
ncbi:hypothetical protein BpHYR1_018755 [Brachionus plicatilis]|uniref:Uncharacterized protein n=1 Tax=Brachionus plicatilis TaxID=10195 RepID=A0A3M7QNR7_BRAPC|nr:hypothetical protein BpHYR1_018755 [Brachionus plicatilis]